MQLQGQDEKGRVMSMQLQGFNDGQRAAFDRARSRLAGTPSGAPVLQRLEADGTTIRLQAEGGHYLPGRNEIRLPAWVLGDSRLAATWLAHEGQHRMDDTGDVRSGVVGLARTGAGAAIAGARQLDNPFTAGFAAMERRQQVTEVNAYRREGMVGRELGMNLSTYEFKDRQGRPSRYATPHGHHADGRLKSRAEVARDVAAQPLYQLPLGTRVGLGLAGTALTAAAVGAAGAVVGRLLPAGGARSAATFGPAALVAVAGAALLAQDLGSSALRG